MTKYLIIIFTVCVSLSAWTHAATYGGGTGTANDPYQIWDPNQMNAIGLNPDDWDKHFKLMADIDMSIYTGTQYNIIGIDYEHPFTGTFDGNGHIISNLIYITTESLYNVGLFGYTKNAEVKNLGVANVVLSIKGYSVGGVAGHFNGTIHNCFSTGNISGYGYCGGLVGECYNGIIDNCYSLGNIAGNYVNGGLVGRNEGGTIIKCFSTGTVSDEGSFQPIGGLVGKSEIFEETTMPFEEWVCDGDGNCWYEYREVPVWKYVEHKELVQLSFWNTETSGVSQSSGGEGKTTAQMRDVNTFLSAGWDFKGEATNGTGEIWTMFPGQYPHMAWQQLTGTNILETTSIVPDIVMMTYSDAEAAIISAGLGLQYVDSHSDTVPYDSVISQTPASGIEVYLSTVVYFEISLGPAATVPDVVGMYGLDAQAAITAAGLTAMIQYEYGSPAEIVISQSPVAGSRVEYGSDVIIMVNSGPSYYEVPDVMGLDEAGARNTIIANGFTVGPINYLYSDFIPEGFVIDQYPAARTYVDWLMPVGLDISMGPQLFTVPDVVGMKQTDAENTIYSAGLYMGTVINSFSDGIAAGYVISQNPAPGTQLPDGSMVGIEVSLGPAVSVPDVVGITQTEAQAALDAAELAANMTLSYSDNVPEGYVISQYPDAGTMVPMGYEVNVIISRGPSPYEGAGSESNPYQISDVNDLLALAADSINYDKCFILTADIDMEGQIFNTAIIAPGKEGQSGIFLGIAFSGIFDGNHHKVMNFTMVSSDDGCLGLFGKIASGGCVKNVGIENSSIEGSCAGGLCGINSGLLTHCYNLGNVTGSGLVGGLCGINEGGIIDDCFATGLVAGDMWVGGLCGSSYGNGMIKNSYATGAVTGTSICVGGLCGSNMDKSEIFNCYATGTVSGGHDLGGLCGHNFGILRDCYATGNIVGQNESSSLGGLCGFSAGSIIACHASGSVNAGSDSYNLGGLCGSIGRFVSHCYATGAVTSGANSYALGGLVGENHGWIKDSYAAGVVTGGVGAYDIGGFCGQSYEGQFSNCFWDTETSGQSTSTGGTGITTARMKTRQTFIDAGWDFTNETENGPVDIWRMCVDGIEYPKFAWQFSGTGDFACPAGVGLEDVSIFINCWLDDCQLKGDITLDGRVNMDDINYLSLKWLLQDYEIGGPYYADVTGDLNVNLEDLIVVADQWLLVSCRRVDINHDDAVDLADLSILAANWLKQ